MSAEFHGVTGSEGQDPVDQRLDLLLAQVLELFVYLRIALEIDDRRGGQVGVELLDVFFGPLAFQTVRRQCRDVQAGRDCADCAYRHQYFGFHLGKLNKSAADAAPAAQAAQPSEQNPLGELDRWLEEHLPGLNKTAASEA